MVIPALSWQVLGSRAGPGGLRVHHQLQGGFAFQQLRGKALEVECPAVAAGCVSVDCNQVRRYSVDHPG